MASSSHPDRLAIASAPKVACREGRVDFVELFAKKALRCENLNKALAITVADKSQQNHVDRLKVFNAAAEPGRDH